MTLEHDAEAYMLALDSAAESFARANPTAFAERATFATLTYLGESGGFRRRMQSLNREAAGAAGFPSFTTWLAATYPQGMAA